jgi:hypothetical protein
VVRRLIPLLASLPAAFRLSSRHSLKCLTDELLRVLVSHAFSGFLKVKVGAVLLEKVINHSSDHEIWSTVYDLVSPPPTRFSVTDTQHVFNYPSNHGGSEAEYSTDEGRRYMDSVIENEMKDHIYLNVPEFFATFFDSVGGLPQLVDAVFARCTSYTDRWSAFPSSCAESNIATWFRQEVDRIVGFALDADPANMHAEALTSRCVVSMPANPLRGSTAPRKVDVGFAALNRADDTKPVWKDILVPGELQEKRSDDGRSSTWYDLGRYVREVYNSQDTRRFCHGFTLCGDVMRVWRFDRGDVYTAPPFSVNEDGRKFVTVVLGYLLMVNDDLGFDPTIVRDGDRRYIPVMQGGVEQRLFIKKPIFRQACILGRATKCWKATLRDSTTSFAIKDSWQYEGKGDEGELLMEVTEAGVRHVAPCYHCSSVSISGMDDDLRSCVRKGLDLRSGKKWRACRGRAAVVLSKSSSSSSLYRRVASATLKSDRNPKRSRSNTQGDSGNGNPPELEDRPQNRVHKRVIMSMCGKQLCLARTRVGVLRGIVDGITGTIPDVFSVTVYF